ncbi:unnamed protein product [Vicia faba]|uniref:Uncharacterized protein n=1 Tax=Vicia faba TaxID=3906 RepID=A0AAV0YNB2_VICFA|nr:unnamed protein product [Vicia faba]
MAKLAVKTIFNIPFHHMPNPNRYEPENSNKNLMILCWTWKPNENENENENGMEANCWQISSSLDVEEVPSGALLIDTKLESTSDKLHNQKDGVDCDSACEEKIRATVVKEITDDSHVKSSPSPDFHNNLRNSPIVDSLCQPALLDPGSELKNGILQIEDNFCVLKDSSADGTDLLSKGNSVSIKDTCPVDNPGQTNNDGQGAVEVDYITESTLLPSQTNSTTTTSNCKTE